MDIGAMQDVVIIAVTVFARTGKRTIRGLLQDGYNSAIRYFMNNFYDGFRQVHSFGSLNTLKQITNTCHKSNIPQDIPTFRPNVLAPTV